MKILYLTAGYSIHDYRFLKKFAEKKYDVYMVSYTSSKEPLVKVEGIKTIRPGLNFKHHFPLIPLHFRKLIREIKPDILHAGYVQTQGFVGALSGFHPFLLMPWGSDILLWLDDKLSFFKRAIAKYTINCADMITCDCEIVKRKIIELTPYPPEKIIVLPWGIDLGIFKPMPEEGMEIRKRLGWQNKKVLIMTRSFLPIYGIEYFIDALPIIIKEIEETRAIIIGDGLGNKALEDNLRGKVSSLGLNDYVHFTGQMKNELIPNHLSAADVYVSSSLSDGTSLCLLEAMACGLALVVTDVPAYFEWVEDGINGYIVPRCSSVNLAKRIIDLLNRPRTQKEFSERNLQIASERADWDKNFGRIDEMYKRLLMRS